MLPILLILGVGAAAAAMASSARSSSGPLPRGVSLTPPPGAPHAAMTDLKALEAQMTAARAQYDDERNAREAAYDSSLDKWGDAVGSLTGPAGKALAGSLVWLAKRYGEAVKALQHNPDAQVYVDDAKRLWRMIVASGLAPPPYGPIADVVFIETYKSNLYDTIYKIRDASRGLAYQPALLELGYWTKQTIGDEQVASWWSALAAGAKGFGNSGGWRGEGRMTTPTRIDGALGSQWTQASSVLAGVVAATVMGVPIAGPVNAALVSLDGVIGRHPGIGSGDSGNREYNLAQLIATAEAWAAAKAQAAKEAGRPFKVAPAIKPPWPMTGDV